MIVACSHDVSCIDIFLPAAGLSDAFTSIQHACAQLKGFFFRLQWAAGTAASARLLMPDEAAVHCLRLLAGAKLSWPMRLRIRGRLTLLTFSEGESWALLALAALLEERYGCPFAGMEQGRLCVLTECWRLAEIFADPLMRDIYKVP